MSDRYDYLAEEAAGNWRKFEAFAWREKPRDADNWMIVDIENRDSNARIRSNADFIRASLRPFTDGGDPDCRFERHSCWLVGWREAISIRVYQGGAITEAFKAFCDINDLYVGEENAVDPGL